MPSNRSNTTRRKDNKCLYCLEILAHPTNKFCNQSCITVWANKRRERPIEERLWDNVEKTDSCWLWHGKSTNNFGHGKIQLNKSNRFIGVHRLSWEIHNGSIPEGMFVCHHCDIPNCINPKHLFIGTQLENMRDRRSKGR